MKTEYANLFPTLTIRYQDFLPQKQRNDILDFVYSQSIFGEHHSIAGNAVSSHEYVQSIIDLITEKVDSCRELKRNLNLRVSEYVAASGIGGNGPVVITNSWINIQYPGSTLHTHTHAGSLISAAMYINVDEKSSPLFFCNPNPYIVATPTGERTQFTYQTTWFNPEPGDLILFPGWLGHGSGGSVNETENRVVLSFNTGQPLDV